jgi:hypothetical protein
VAVREHLSAIAHLFFFFFFFVKVVGVVLWGVYDKVPLARAIITRAEKYPTPEHLTNLISLEMEEHH